VFTFVWLFEMLSCLIRLCLSTERYNVGLEIHTNVAIDTENIHDCNVDERISKSEENNEVACSNSSNIASIIGKSESKAEVYFLYQ
jgi:hypothetical protein